MLCIVFQKVFSPTFSTGCLLKLFSPAPSSAQPPFDTERTWENSSHELNSQSTFGSAWDKWGELPGGSPKPEEKRGSLHRKAKLWLWQGMEKLLGALKHSRVHRYQFVTKGAHANQLHLCPEPTKSINQGLSVSRLCCTWLTQPFSLKHLSWSLHGMSEVESQSQHLSVTPVCNKWNAKAFFTVVIIPWAVKCSELLTWITYSYCSGSTRSTDLRIINLNSGLEIRVESFSGHFFSPWY